MKIDDPRKHALAQDLIASTEFSLSAQVLTEFASSLLRKHAMAPAEISLWLDQLEAFPVLPTDTDLVRGALVSSQRYKISYWDGAIIAAADRLGAPVLYTEDLNHGQNYGSVKVVNPFRAM
ncbi:MAG: PIN domain-containing protein [Rhizobiaceae bacterium]|jgi:predicted nucleic acid-binding protein|nr:PIN domain-containing protein [Rhizobiaceae bacterium]